ncbi:MAG: fumarate hydratase [Candidatus Omnitrophica bacterium]|jgi:fumarate hydratase subunit alpha|nr:fumarate hydratase [Candidatus Omnitrophota bacterium]
MRLIKAQKISDAVADLCLKANFKLRPDVLAGLKAAYERETNRRAKTLIKAILDNAAIAAKEKVAICQDTGLPCVFLEIGQDVHVSGNINQAVFKGIKNGYRKGYFRESIVRDPVGRGASGYTPGIIYIDIVKGNKIKISVLPKGFGSENKSQLKMFNPTASVKDIKKFIVDAVKIAGPDACPPYVVGVGIGGTADHACLLAKKALLKKIGHPQTAFEKDLLKTINKLNIGPMGLGGKTTALAVKIEEHPTHIAGMPVAVNISCHATRSASAVI